MTDQQRDMSNQENIRLLYDLAIYNCLHFGTYKMLIYEDSQQVREYTNQEIAREATQLAAGLRSLGIQKGDRVIVMMLNCPEVIISYQAIARAGAIIIPVLPLLKGPEVRYIAENSAAKAIITDNNLLPLLRNALADVPTMQHIISTGIEANTANDEPRSHTIHAYKDIVAKGAVRRLIITCKTWKGCRSRRTISPSRSTLPARPAVRKELCSLIAT